MWRKHSFLELLLLHFVFVSVKEAIRVTLCVCSAAFLEWEGHLLLQGYKFHELGFPRNPHGEHFWHKDDKLPAAWDGLMRRIHIQWPPLRSGCKSPSSFCPGRRKSGLPGAPSPAPRSLLPSLCQVPFIITIATVNRASIKILKA